MAAMRRRIPAKPQKQIKTGDGDDINENENHELDAGQRHQPRTKLAASETPRVFDQNQRGSTAMM